MSIIDLRKIATEVRINVINMTSKAKSGYLGGSLSCVEILTALYFGKANGKNLIKYDIKRPGWEDQDYFVLSKAHAASTLYAVLSKVGFFEKEELGYFNQLGSNLPLYPNNKIRGITVASGSAGHGLSIANGIALGLKLDKKENKIYVLVGDGEFQEGQIWEALLTTAQHKLNNVYLLIDENAMQADDHLGNIKNINPIQDKLEAFGWEVFKIVDGNDIKKILGIFELIFKTNHQKPICIIMPTIKGKGVSFAENKTAYHYGFLGEEEMAIAIPPLEKSLMEQE